MNSAPTLSGDSKKELSSAITIAAHEVDHSYFMHPFLYFNEVQLSGFELMIQQIKKWVSLKRRYLMRGTKKGQLTRNIRNLHRWIEDNYIEEIYHFHKQVNDFMKENNIKPSPKK